MSNSKKILLVIDDDHDICQILKTRFQREGLDVTVANEGGKGFQYASERIPDCVLLDIRITPGEDGLTFLRKIRSYRNDDPSIEKRMREVPVIVLTALDTGMKDLFEMEGISGFFEKPYDYEALKSKVFEVVDSKA